MDEIRLRATRYIEDEPDSALGAKVQAWLDSDTEEARTEIQSRFGHVLAFGTAGLRGAMGPGTARMNRVMVTRASYGLGRYLQERASQKDFNEEQLDVVVAFDGRTNSRVFAEDTAAVLAGLGIKVRIFGYPVATPVAAYAVHAFSAAAGVMVTASHNPPEDNGYKVYWHNGAQIIPPHDTGIAAYIQEAPVLSHIKRLTPMEAIKDGLREAIAPEIEERYLRGVKNAALHTLGSEKEDLKVVFTAMHGVGNRYVTQAFADAGFPYFYSVPEQAEPDPAFPTVQFPNPEEEGALDLALQAAQTMRADLVLANDPDADRISVSIPVLDERKYVSLSGNEVGVLLGADALENSDTRGKTKLVITTLVSTSMLGKIAAAYDASYAETLTGFKWIANVAMERERDEGEAFVMGFEEALGVSVGPLVRDKDGVSAAIRIAELAASLKSEGKTLFDRLDDLALAHGLHLQNQWSVNLRGNSGQQQIQALMKGFRDNPFSTLGGSPVAKRVDLGAEPAAGFAKGTLPAANVLVFFTEAGDRLLIRPSGTEPKVKFYLEACKDVSKRSLLSNARQELEERLTLLREEISMVISSSL